MLWGSWAQCHLGRGIDIYALVGVALDRFFSVIVFVIEAPHSNRLLAGFVGFQWKEARIIKTEKYSRLFSATK